MAAQSTGVFLVHLANAVSRWLFFVGAVLLLVRMFGPSPSMWLIWPLLASPVIAAVGGVAYFLRRKTEPGGSPGTDENPQ